MATSVKEPSACAQCGAVAKAGGASRYPAFAEHQAPAALLAAIGALIVVAFAGAAIAVILAVSSSDSTPSSGTVTHTTTITVTSNAN